MENQSAERIKFLIELMWITLQGETISKKECEVLTKELDMFKENLFVAAAFQE